MTREEAKEILTHNWTRVDNPNYSESELDEAFFMAIEALSADAESKGVLQGYNKGANTIKTIRHEELTQIANTRKAVESADAEPTETSTFGEKHQLSQPKWNCTSSFVAEQLERLRNMTDEEKWNFFREFFGMGDAVHGEWTPCGEKMPKELERVNVTWLNHNPPFYYQHIKDIPQTDTAVYYRGKWYWWDATVIDVLAEYGEDCNAEQIDKDIEVVAWMPLPKPYREESEVEG